MDLVARLTTFEELAATDSVRAFWLSRPPAERIAEVERLRREYVQCLQGARPDGNPERLRGSLRLVERAQR
jgi:hypothetical protein